jgi:hypothetical protein
MSKSLKNYPDLTKAFDPADACNATMTLNLGLTNPFGAFLVTDRLVTDDRAPVDTVANKNLVYLARNGILAIGYTGFAYFDNAPTDQWLAETLLDTRFDRGQQVANMIGASHRVLTIAEAMESLQNAVSRATPLIDERFRSQWLPSEFDVLSVGYEWTDEEWWCVIHGISKASGEAECTRETVQRRFQLVAAPASTSGSDHLEPVNHTIRGATSASEVENALVAGVRSAAARHRTVGRDCLVIHVGLPTTASAVVRFSAQNPEKSKEAIPVGYRVRRTMPVAYSPWVIGPGMVHPPSRLVGDHEAVFGRHYTVTLKGAAPTGPVVVASSSQRRRSPPR